MDRFALKKRKKGPNSGNVATNSANPHVVWTPQAEATNDRFSASSWLAAPPLPRQNRGSQVRRGYTSMNRCAVCVPRIGRARADRVGMIE